MSFWPRCWRRRDTAGGAVAGASLAASGGGLGRPADVSWKHAIKGVVWRKAGKVPGEVLLGEVPLPRCRTDCAAPLERAAVPMRTRLPVQERPGEACQALEALPLLHRARHRSATYAGERAESSFGPASLTNKLASRRRGPFILRAPSPLAGAL